MIPGVLNEERIREVRASFHTSLRDVYNVDYDNLSSTCQNLKALSSTNGAGGILDLFYFDWKLALNEDPVIFQVMQELWSATYGNDHLHFQHPYGPFQSQEGYMYIDRVCFRLSDDLAIPVETSVHDSSSKKSKKKSTLQRSLTPHLDCCPHDMYSGRKWRPIQMFLALTDTLVPNHGGFEACKGLHRDFETWSNGRLPSEKGGKVPCVGQFTPIRPKEDADIIARMEHIPCRAGDLVCWDYRIPHANALYNQSGHVREVIYLGFLPAVPLNEAYARDQLSRYLSGSLPADQWHESRMTQECVHEFSELGRKLMSIDPWASSA